MESSTSRRTPARPGVAGVRSRSRTAAVALAAFACALGNGAALAAQEPGGRIVGRIISARTAEPLVGAQVYIPDLDIGVLTGPHGRYALMRVPAGVHRVEVRIVGYTARTLSGVHVSEDTTVVLEIALSPRALQLDAITVTATRERGSTAALLADRMGAPVVSDAIGAEQIARSPDGDAAAALRRVPGVSVVDGKYVLVRGLGERYGKTTLNGAPLLSPEPDRTAVPLDLVRSTLLESIVTAKAYTPDKPGDYAGGLVQINTRDFSGFRTFKLSGSTSYNTEASFAHGLGYAGGGWDDFGFDDGTRDLPAPLPRDRPLTGLSASDLERIGEAFSGDWAPVPERIPASYGFGLSFGDQLELADRPFSFIGSITHSNHSSHRADAIERVFSNSGIAEPEVDYTGTASTRAVALGALLNLGYELSSTHRVSLSTIASRLTDDEARIFEGLNHDANTDQRNMRIRYLSRTLFHSQLAGEHDIAGLGHLGVEWRVAYSRASRYEPDTREMLYRQTASGRFLWENFIQSASIFHQDMDEDGVSGAIDLRIPFTFRSLPASISLGTSADLSDRTTYTRRFRFVPASGASIGEAVRTLPPNEMLSAATIGPGGFEVREATFATDNYDAEQNVLAGYLMVDAEALPRLRLMGGARFEQARQTVDPRAFGETSGPDPIPGSELDDADVLPAVHLTYAVTGAMNLRLGASRTLARPQLREIAPFSYADYAGGHLVLGNTLLERSRIRNYDLRWEWMPRPGAVLALSGFYKRFQEPIEALVLPSTELKKTWVNADEATSYGLELEVRSSLAFLGAGFDALSFNANLTLVDSEVATGGTVRYFDAGQPQSNTLPARDRALQGQSPYVVNLGLSYFHPALGTSATALYHRFGRRIDAVGSAEIPDLYEEARGQLDLVLEQPLPWGFSAELSAHRLLGNEVRFTQGGGVVRGYDTGRTFSLSASWSPGGR